MTSSAGGARPAHGGDGLGVSPAVVEAVAGLTAGSMATLVVHPLDIVKTRMQIYSKSDAATRPSSAAIVRGLLAKPRPVAALYRGLAPNLLGSGTSWAAFFFCKARVEGAVRRATGHVRLTPADSFVASGLAGACVQVLLNPLWVLKTRMLASDRGARGAYPGMVAGARRVLREEGVRGFYRGLAAGLLGVSHGAVQFGVYDPLVGWLRRRRAAERGPAGAGTDGRPAALLSNTDTLLVASVAKLVAGAATYPYQVVRSRLQNYDADARYGRGMAGVSRQLWREDGLRGFYRGLVPSVIRVMPATWVTFLVYENMKAWMGGQ